ncbi:MAG: hypothetical protein U0401_09795 [Anaerolineae bacterium]
MAADVHSREQRLRKQAELQRFSLNLANLRKQEASYIEVSAAIPELLLNQINETRREIRSVEGELLALNDESIRSQARQFYTEAFEAELNADIDKAIKLYRNAARHNHPDAGLALRSLRYHLKTTKNKAIARTWTPPAPMLSSRGRLLVGLTAGSILVLTGIFVIQAYLIVPPEVAVLPTATFTPPTVILIIPATATPTSTSLPTATATDTPAPTFTLIPLPTKATPTIIPSRTPAPTPRPAPKIVGPQNYLVWLDGAIVFEFEDMGLADDELYCLNTLKGFDQTNTENWSYPPTGNKKPRIPIDANVIRVAKTQGMQCIIWSASIGKNSCNNIISQRTEERMIGLPQPCNFR